MTTSRPETQALQDALARLDAHDYRCYRPYSRPAGYGQPPNPNRLFTGKVIDTETNGLHQNAKIFEIGIVTFEYDAAGNIYRILDAVTMFEDIGEPLRDDIQTITGRTDADIQGQRFDEGIVQNLCTIPGIFIAHNAEFDRPKLERRFPALRQTAWGCSLKDVDWLDHGVVDTKLRLLAMDIGGFHFHGHQAENDCLALLEILTRELPGSHQTVFQHILSFARTKQMRVYAIDAPYDQKAALKAAGFQWQDAAPRAWYCDIGGNDDDVAALKQWLRDAVYPYPVADNMLAVAAISALNRHSGRIAPEPTYLRHIVPFGKKHHGDLIADVARDDPDFLRWALQSMDTLEPDLRRTFAWYLQ